MSSIGGLAGARVLVTGGAGFIGSHLVDALVSAEAKVRVLDDLSTGLAANLDAARERIEFIEGDLRDGDAVNRAVEGCSLVFHQAALGSVPRSMSDPFATLDVNVTGTARIFSAARSQGVTRIVYASSSSVYGDSPALPKLEGEEGKPLSPYALSKKTNEELAEVFARCFGMTFVGLRYFNVYGPRQRPEGSYAAVIPRFFAALLEKRPPIVHGDGEQSRDFTFVDDAVRANLLAATVDLPERHTVVNVAGGERTTINHVADLVRNAVGAGPPPGHAPERPGDVRHSLADLDRARRLLGYEPATALSAGLAACIDHYSELFAAA